ncbi:hypothetical protein GCM10009127_27760 [Alteraurantiacibacter aestuarii]|uniref:Peptidyl-prolyl cis-trans isomerase n=1 Tax=Alteraurantiacibacter aestuarii TaxID=650004 RepID=A0A844ZPB2_9SPHN|nr:FKBP-type peptidyl-prolyl cis-trans isomerase [Alteraurantiacibacter aestuarii]MXO88886.1 peptidylprolyl isomerase [Alteraurantiacibacter aestuarii]
MAEVTRVPLQPIAKGSMMKFWLGMLVGIVLAGSVAWFTSRPASVSVDTITAGEGESPTETDVVFVHYTGKLEDGTVFDQSQDANWPVPGILPDGTPLPLDRMIPGFKEALMQMQRGGSYKVEIPSELGYGATPQPGSPIPPNADLTFDIELVDFMSPDEAEQRYQSMLQALEQQQPAEGAAQADVPPAG